MGNPRRGFWLALVLVAAVAGCGASGRAPDAAKVTEHFEAALARQDGASACRELSEQTRSKLEQHEKKPCERAILGIGLPRAGAATKTSVYVTSASVALAGGDTAFLDEGPQGWKISAAGCRPTAPDQPYDCELEG